MITFALVIYLFLVSSPNKVGIPQPVEDETKLTEPLNSDVPQRAISICNALIIPGVVSVRNLKSFLFCFRV
jgi:hypothetical protein